MKIYLAGPQVFTPQGERFAREKLIPAIQEIGHEPLFPSDTDTNPDDDRIDIEDVMSHPMGKDRTRLLNTWAMQVGEKNQRDIDEADAVVANLDEPDPDSGTAAEVGYAYGRDLPIIGYRTDRRTAGESEGVVVNLQLEYFIKASGGVICTRDQWAGEWSPDHYRFYHSEEEMIEQIIGALHEL